MVFLALEHIAVSAQVLIAPTAAVKAHQEKTPGIFGSEGGLSRVFSMMEVAASLGMTIGPIVSGVLKENLGYTYMSWTWSKSIQFPYAPDR